LYTALGGVRPSAVSIFYLLSLFILSMYLKWFLFISLTFFCLL
jgi:hypothetical protein